MSRLAFFTPLPPAPSGVADYAADVLRLLEPRHQIDVFVDQPETAAFNLPQLRVLPFQEYAAEARGLEYDAVIHQLGNGTEYRFVLDAVQRIGGLLVLHDLVLHHARARLLTESAAVVAYRADPSNAALRDAARQSLERYRTELAAEYPAQPLLADVQLETTGRLLPYAYPFFRGPAAAADVIAGHNRALLDRVLAEVPDALVTPLAMPMQEPPPVGASVIDELRTHLGIRGSEIVVATFGLLTAEKEVDVLARAVGRAIRLGAPLRLLLVGPVPDRSGLDAALTAAGIADKAIVTGRVPLEELPAHIAATDIAVHLRYPTARETSAALLRVLAQGRATIVSDLDNFAAIPADAVVKVRVTDEEGEVTRALLRLAASSALRARLGTAAAAHVAVEHSEARCLADYETAIALAQDARSTRDSKPIS